MKEPSEGVVATCIRCDWAIFDDEDYLYSHKMGVYIHRGCLNHLHELYDVVKVKGNGKAKSK